MLPPFFSKLHRPVWLTPPSCLPQLHLRPLVLASRSGRESTQPRAAERLFGTRFFENKTAATNKMCFFFFRSCFLEFLPPPLPGRKAGKRGACGFGNKENTGERDLGYSPTKRHRGKGKTIQRHGGRSEAMWSQVGISTP